MCSKTGQFYLLLTLENLFADSIATMLGQGIIAKEVKIDLNGGSE